MGHLLPPRQLERPFYSISPWIAEFWCTLSNLPFILIGGLRLWEGTEIPLFYWLFLGAGFCSSFHHASCPTWSWTIVIDWLPISVSILLGLYEGVFWTVQSVTLLKVAIAFLILLTDHWYTPVPVPWGHSFWHILAAFAFDEVYQDFEYLFDPNLF